MNREEAKFKRVGDFNIVYTAVNLRIDEIYDYFESRTCESCRHFQNKINEEEITCNYHFGFYPVKYKYCGHWEDKYE
jgi:hypothetical protein